MPTDVDGNLGRETPSLVMLKGTVGCSPRCEQNDNKRQRSVDGVPTAQVVGSSNSTNLGTENLLGRYRDR